MTYNPKVYGCSILILLFFTIKITEAKKNNVVISVAKYYKDKPCALSYTFDDGLLEHYTLVFPRFESLGFKGTFWVNGQTIFDGKKELTDNPRASWEQLKSMAEKGQEISNHGWSHKNLTRCSPEEIRIEIERNDSMIEARIGERPKTFCYAYNAKNDSIIKLASANRVGTRTFQFSMGSKSTDENLEKRMTELIDSTGWSVAMIHGITYGYDAFTNDSILWNHLDWVKTREKQIWVATFRDVAAYVTERDSVRLNITNKHNTFIIKPVLSLNPELFHFPLTMKVHQNGIRKIKVIQDNKQLKVMVLPDKALFDFDPYGGSIEVKMK